MDHKRRASVATVAKCVTFPTSAGQSDSLKPKAKGRTAWAKNKFEGQAAHHIVESEPGDWSYVSGISHLDEEFGARRS